MRDPTPQVLTVLLKHRCSATTTFVNEAGIDLFRKMVRHLGNFSVMQVAKLLLLPKHAALQGKPQISFLFLKKKSTVRTEDLPSEPSLGRRLGRVALDVIQGGPSALDGVKTSPEVQGRGTR